MATAQLIVNIAADISEIVTGVNAVKQHLESLGMKVKQQNVLMKEVGKSTKGMFDEMTKGWVGWAAKFNTLDYSLRILKNALMSTFGQGFKAVDEFRLGTASAAAVVMQFMELKPGESLAEGFQRATAYAEDMYPVLEKIAAQTLLSGRHTQMMFQEFAKGGVLLDASNEKAVAGFKAMGNAIAIMTKGQDVERQIMTEIKAVMEGENRAGAVMIRLLEAQNPKIKEQLKLWRDQGTILEHMGELLQGFDLASGKLEMTLDAVVTRLQTSMQQIARGAFTESFDKMLSKLIEIDNWLQKNKDVIANDIKIAWTAIEGTLSSIVSLIGRFADGVELILGDMKSISVQQEGIYTTIRKINDEQEKQRSSVRTLLEGWAYLLAVILPGTLDLVANIGSAIFNAGAAVNALTDAWFYGITLQGEKAQKSLDEMEKYAKKAWKSMFPGEGIFSQYAEEWDRVKASIGGLLPSDVGKQVKPPATKKIADDVEKDAKKIQDAYEKMMASLQTDIDTYGLEKWQAELIKLRDEVVNLQKQGLSNLQIADVVHLKLQLIGLQKAEADLKRVEEQSKAIQKALDEARRECESLAEAAYNLDESFIALDVSLGSISEMEGLQKQVDNLSKYIAELEKMKQAAEGALDEQGWNKLAIAINNNKVKVEELKNKLNELKGSQTFAQGLGAGIDEYVKSLEFGFERGKDMAREAAESMQSFFEDVFVGRIKVTWKDLMGWMGGLFAKLVAEMTTKLVMMTGIVEKLGGSFAGIMSGSMGTTLGGLGLGTVAGGIVGGGSVGSLAGGAAGAGLMSFTGLGATTGNALSGLFTGGTMALSIMSSIVPILGGVIGAGLGKLIEDLVSSGHSPNLQLGTMGTPDQAWRTQFGEGDFTLRKWNEIGSKNTQQILKVFDTLKESMKSFMTDMNMDLSKLDETWKSTMADADSNIQKVINRWVGEYASFLTGIDFKSFQRSGEEMADTVSRVISAIGGMKMLGENIDLVIQYIENSTDAFRQFKISINELDRQIQDTKNNMAGLTDPSEIFDAANELYTLTMQRYEAEIQFVQELQQAIQDLQIEFAQFTSSMTKKIAELGGDTGGFDDAIKMIADAGRGLAQQLMNPDISLGEKLPMLKNFLSFLDEWYQLNLDKIQVVGEAEIAIYEDRIESLNKEKDLINDQIDALQTQLKLVEDWQDVLDKTKDMIFDLKSTTASPRDVFERLNYVKGEIERVQGQFRGSSGESQIGFAKELQTLIQSYGQIGQEAFQRPSMEYQAVYNDMLTWLQEIESVASVGAKSTEDLLGEIEKLQGRSNDIEREIADWQNKIYIVEERMENSIADLNREAQGYYKWAMDAGNTIYAGKLDTLQTTLASVLGPDGTVAQYIERQRADMVTELEGVKDYLNGILYGLTGYNALAVPSYQHGTSYVPQTGLAYLHKGETVIPANGGINLTLAPTIYANGDATPREIWRELEDYAVQSVKGGRLRKALQEK